MTRTDIIVVNDVRDLRTALKRMMPHVKIQTRKVYFDGEPKRFLKISGDRNRDELDLINLLGREAGLLPDGNIRGYDLD